MTTYEDLEAVGVNVVHGVAWVTKLFGELAAAQPAPTPGLAKRAS